MYSRILVYNKSVFLYQIIGYLISSGIKDMKRHFFESTFFFPFYLGVGGWLILNLKKNATKSFCFAVNQLQDRILS